MAEENKIPAPAESTKNIPKREDYASKAEYMRALLEWIKEMMKNLLRNQTFSMINPELREKLANAEPTFTAEETATLLAMNCKETNEMREELRASMEKFAEALKKVDEVVAGMARGEVDETKLVDKELEETVTCSCNECETKIINYCELWKNAIITGATIEGVEYVTLLSNDDGKPFVAFLDKDRQYIDGVAFSLTDDAHIPEMRCGLTEAEKSKVSNTQDIPNFVGGKTKQEIGEELFEKLTGAIGKEFDLEIKAGVYNNYDSPTQDNREDEDVTKDESVYATVYVVEADDNFEDFEIDDPDNT